MNKYNQTSNKEKMTRYLIVTLLLSTTIFIENYSIPIWSYVIGILIMFSNTIFNAYKWLSRKPDLSSPKEQLVKNASMVIVASLFIIVPFKLTLWIVILFFTASLIALIWEYKKNKTGSAF